MRKIKKIIFLFTAVCCTLMASGCEWTEKINEFVYGSPENEQTEEQAKEVTNSISVGLLDFDTFNPLLTRSETVKECMQLVYEPLFELNEKIQPVPSLASGYNVSPDGRTIDISLKNNVTWQDGTIFNANDVIYTFNQIRTGVTPYTENIADAAKWKATDDYSVRITLNYAVPNFVSLLTFPIIKNKTGMTLNSNYIPVGTGAFRYERQISTGKLSFAAYDGFFKGRAKIDNVYVYTVPDMQKYETMFEVSEIDVITGETVDLSEYTPRGLSKNNEYVTNKMTFVGYNINSKLLGGRETRKGLTKIIDKEAIVNSVIYSRGVACDVPINPSSIYYYDTNTKFKADEANASKHLGNDGWGPDKDGKYVRTIDGKRQVMGFDILTNSDSNEKVSIANRISESFKNFGIPSTVTALPYEQYVAKINSHDFDIMIGEIEVGANLDLTPLVSSGGNYFSYYNPELDTLIGQMGMTSDENQLKMLFTQYSEKIVNDMPFSVLFYRKGNVISGAKIKSEMSPAIGRMYRNVEMWSVK